MKSEKNVRGMSHDFQNEKINEKRAKEILEIIRDRKDLV